MKTGAGSLSDRLGRARGSLGDLAPGIMVSVILAIAAKFMSEHYGAPAMLMALLLGIALQFLSEEGRCASGIAFSAKTLLRVGVALLGARISADILIGLGPELIALVILGSVATILFGLVCARLLGRGWRLALLTGGSVAICGASAAMAIAAILPRNEHSERNLSFTILSVTVLSTVAMMVYPVLSEMFDLDARTAGVFLGGTIHDVAQVVGAGFSISTETGDIATLVKLIRVTMLAPVVLVFALIVRGAGLETPDGGKRPPLIPIFVLAFLGFALLSTLGAIPPAGVEALGDLSRWALLTAIAAVGMKTSLRRIREVGGQAVALIVAETIFIGGFILAGVHVLGDAGG
ncbi:YeiH family putative sulfate export transporter [Marivibrio halodurans]|uniref:YeiH family putative sulfate export transporter n=1 Tax=Marivibrio halodurans TaxID=2039722 RepID=A0A8J7S398_9PROT|nr:YeiH family protein [Marivibrio halodurans]MBP5859045.1 YeiH family putative sulfate export transporter [Marivibrio halodurans]